MITKMAIMKKTTKTITKKIIKKLKSLLIRMQRRLSL